LTVSISGVRDKARQKWAKEVGSKGGRKRMQETALELFEGLASSYERALDWATLAQDRYWKKRVARLARLQKGQVVLDVGSGTLLLEERLLPSGASFVGLDLTMPMIRMGMAKRLPSVAVVNGDAESLPFPDKSFDMVLSCYVVKYVNPEKFAGELARVTKPGGKVVLYDFVAPAGMTRPALELYLRGVIAGAGFLLTLAKSDAAFTFRNLPKIVEGAVWAGGFRELMEANFETVEARRMTGGVVGIYAGVRRRPGESRA
jgi:demethylmenaquinone methyltransferase/2-methoxy-6-polyprenyl-1,4-benzoquinol methylase